MELSLPVKATIGVGSAASAAAGGVYLTSSSGSSTDQDAKSKESLDLENKLSNELSKKPVINQKINSLYYVSDEFKRPTKKPNIGTQYSLFLVSPLHDLDTWNSYYEEFKQESEKEELFSSVVGPHTLSQVCYEIYKKQNRDTFIKIVKDPAAETSIPHEKTQLINQFWKYCSYIKEKPVLVNINLDTFSNTKISEKYPHFLPKADAQENTKFWEFKQAWFDQLTDQNKPEKENFDSYVNKKGSAVKESNVVSLKKFCKSAIEENLTGTEIKPLTVLSYCSHENYPFSEIFETDGIREKTN